MKQLVNRMNKEAQEAELTQFLLNAVLSRVTLFTANFEAFLTNHNGWQLFDCAMQLDIKDAGVLSVFRNSEWELMDTELKEVRSVTADTAPSYPQYENIYWNAVIGQQIVNVSMDWMSIDDNEQKVFFPRYLLFTFSNNTDLLIAPVDILTNKEHGLIVKYNQEGDILACFDKQIIKRYLEVFKEG